MIVYGKQVFLYVLQKHFDWVEEVYLAKEVDSKIFSKLKGLKILRVDSKRAQALARGGNHQGFLAKIRNLTPIERQKILKMQTLLVLCGISDVGNIGSLARSAYAMGVDAMVICGELSYQALEGAIRTSAGAMLDLPFCLVPTPLSLIHELKQAGFFCYGATMGGEEVSQNISRSHWALFLGSEGEGLSAKITQKMDKIISIKMKNCFNSLNVGVAGGILMHRLMFDGREK